MGCFKSIVIYQTTVDTFKANTYLGHLLRGLSIGYAFGKVEINDII